MAQGGRAAGSGADTPAGLGRAVGGLGEPFTRSSERAVRLGGAPGRGCQEGGSGAARGRDEVGALCGPGSGPGSERCVRGPGMGRRGVCKREARRKTFCALGCGRECTAGSQAKGCEVCRVQQKRSCHGFLTLWLSGPQWLGGGPCSALGEGRGARAGLRCRPQASPFPLSPSLHP